MSKKAMTLIAFVVVAACGGSGQTASDTTPSPPAALTPSASAQPSGNLDPCQLVTQSEASTLAGVSFGVGTKETVSSGATMCTYGGQTRNVFLVEVAVAPDAATAQADWAQEESQAQSALTELVTSSGASVNLKAGDITLTGADKAATATASKTVSGVTLSISAIYVLKGAVFFTFSDLVLGKPAPSVAAMEAQAQTVLTRV
jgi:hypothetical protein